MCKLLLIYLHITFFITNFAPVKIISRRDGRVVDYSGLENRRTERYRGFESLSLREP